MTPKRAAESVWARQQEMERFNTVILDRTDVSTKAFSLPMPCSSVPISHFSEFLFIIPDFVLCLFLSNRK